MPKNGKPKTKKRGQSIPGVLIMVEIIIGDIRLRLLVLRLVLRLLVLLRLRLVELRLVLLWLWLGIVGNIDGVLR